MPLRFAQTVLSMLLTLAFAAPAMAADGPVCEAIFSAKPLHQKSADDGKYGTLRSDFKLNKHYAV